MAKYLLRLKAREMRSTGESVKTIAKILGVSRSTASVWVRDIIMSIEQLEKLRENAIKGGEVGRTKGALSQKLAWIKRMEDFKNTGLDEVGHINDRELLLVGIGLYWAEGSKKTRTVQLCNSDPNLIKFMMWWFTQCLKVPVEDIKGRVGINESHRKRDEVVKKYWSNISGIPISRFTKTSFKRAKINKVYDNFEDHYGTLSIVVLKSSRFYGRIMGLIDGLYKAGCRLASQGVS